MAGKFVPLWRLNLCFISGILLFSLIVPVCLADEDAEIYKQKENICSLIEKGRFSEAKAATDKMVIEFSGSARMPGMLYWIARSYSSVDKFDDTKVIYQKIIHDFPESTYAGRAKVGNTTSEAISLVISGKYEEAKAVTAQMASDFAGNPDLPGAFFWLAERYQRIDKFDEAKRNYQRIIDDFPAGPYTQKAKFAISRAQAESLIVSQKYDEAKAALDKFISDFAKSPELPGALYWLAERYERLARLDYAKNNYQRIIEQFPNNLYAKRAKLGISRAEVIAFIETNDFNNAGIVLNKMATDFAGHPDLPKTLYWLAVRYQYFGRVEDANRLYQQIVQNYPDNIYASKVAARLRPDNGIGTTPGQAEVKDVNLNPDLENKAVELYRVARGYEEANDFNSAAKAYEQVVKDDPATIKGSNAVLDIRRLEILKAIDSNEANLADILLAKFVADFNQNPYAGDCLDLLVDKCYWTATELMKQNKHQQGISRFSFTENILQLIIDKKTSGNSTIGNTDNFEALYFYAAGCRQLQGKWDKAIEYLQKVVNDYPSYDRACNAQAAIGWCYEALARRESWPKEAALPLIEEAYKAVLDKYPDCYMAAHPAYRLAEMSVEKGDKVNAIMYYKKFLELASQGDGRIEKVKAEITSLEESK